MPWTGTVDARVTAAVGATEAGYLHPITRALNPNFKGVVYVGGKVIVSGTVRSRVTLAASGDVILGDNIKQATDPSVGVVRRHPGDRGGRQHHRGGQHAQRAGAAARRQLDARTSGQWATPTSTSMPCC